MNKQLKTKNGVVVSRGIEWSSYTSNAIGGCKYGCRWKMPDGKIAVCYAENVAEGVAQKAYPFSFAHHYWHPEKLDEPLAVLEPQKIFGDSMADWMGHWVPDDQIILYLESMRRAHWHTYIMLTKNAPRLLKFKHLFPRNLWVLASSPPDFFMGHELSQTQRDAMLTRQLQVLSQIGEVKTGMSIEPLSWDISPILAQYPDALDWAILGAASNGRTYYQPDAASVRNVLGVLDRNKVACFYKGNLRGNAAADPWREEFPE